MAKLERVMPTLHPVIKPLFPIIECPTCKVAMVLKHIRPILFTDDLYTTQYRCIGCNTEIKREFKREHEPVAIV